MLPFCPFVTPQTAEHKTGCYLITGHNYLFAARICSYQRLHIIWTSEWKRFFFFFSSICFDCPVLIWSELGASAHVDYYLSRFTSYVQTSVQYNLRNWETNWETRPVLAVHIACLIGGFLFAVGDMFSDTSTSISQNITLLPFLLFCCSCKWGSAQILFSCLRKSD